jgi:hypothetical protein
VSKALYEGGEDAVRSMKRSLRRRYDPRPVRVGPRECRASKFRAKAMEAAKSLEAQP